MKWCSQAGQCSQPLTCALPAVSSKANVPHRKLVGLNKVNSYRIWASPDMAAFKVCRANKRVPIYVHSMDEIQEEPTSAKRKEELESRCCWGNYKASC